ncbi:Protein-glutamate methylesterase/protein-glutamine glutaminase [Streptomyces glaucescens]
MVRQGFTVLLNTKPDIEVIGQAVDGLDAVAKVAELDPDVVLMDIRMPELGGIEATRRVTASTQRTRVLVLTTFDLDEYVYEALRAGASGFLLKDAPRTSSPRRYGWWPRGTRCSRPASPGG